MAVTKNIQNRTVCFFNSNHAWGGGEKWHLQHAISLRNLGYQVLVVTGKKSALFEKAKNNGLRVKSFHIFNLSFLDPIFITYLARFFMREKVDTVIFGLSKDVKTGGIAARMAGIKKRIYRRGSAVPVRDSLLNRFLFRHILTQTVANSVCIREAILENNPKLIPPGKLRLIYNAVHIPGREMRPKAHQHKIQLTNAGRLVEQKGQHYLVKVAATLKKEGYPFTMSIAGSGKLAKPLKAMAVESGLNGEFRLCDFQDEITLFLKDSDIFLFPSLHEGTANVLLEVMAMGIPVVAFNVSSMPEMIVDGETGYLVPLGDTAAFTEKVKILIENPQLRVSLGENARKRVQERFNWEHQFSKFMQLINEE